MANKQNTGPTALKRLERRYSWGVIGAIIGLVGIAIGFREKHAAIGFFTLAASNVFDVHTSVSGLDVSYRGESLQHTNLNLKALAIEVGNIGDVDILQNAYDEALPWGFRVTSGRIVDIKVVDASSEYLLQRLSPHRISDTQVTFNKVILDRGASFTIFAFVLHPKGAVPRVVPMGKIAGIDHFYTEHEEAEKADPLGTALPAAFSGSTLTQIVRLIGYGIAFMVVVIAGLAGPAIVSIKLDAWHAERKRRQIQAVADAAGADESGRDVIEAAYTFGGESDALHKLEGLLDDREKLAELVRQQRRIDKSFVRRRPDFDADAYRNIPMASSAPPVFRYLVRSDVVAIDNDGEVSVDEEFVLGLRAVNEHLRGKSKSVAT